MAMISTSSVACSAIFDPDRYDGIAGSSGGDDAGSDNETPDVVACFDSWTPRFFDRSILSQATSALDLPSGSVVRVTTGTSPTIEAVQGITLDGPLALETVTVGGADVTVLLVHALRMEPGALLQGVGSQPLVIAALDISIDGTIDVSSSNNAFDSSAIPRIGAGAGRGAHCDTGGGGDGEINGTTTGEGGSGAGSRGGGGDGGLVSGARSGRGGGRGDLVDIGVMIRPGCHGGSGAGTGGVTAGGAGGGAIQLSGCQSVTVGAGGSILAFGASGFGGSIPYGGGGGGGSGGYIGFDAPSVDLLAGDQILVKVAANGGAGGAGSGLNSGLQGLGGGPATTISAARGGIASGNNGTGGGGSYGSDLVGGVGDDGATSSRGSGGGGGGAGVILILRDDDDVVSPGLFSPAPLCGSQLDDC